MNHDHTAAARGSCVEVRLLRPDLTRWREGFASLYLGAFPKRERRRISFQRDFVSGDDGELPGRSIEELLERDDFFLHGYFVGGDWAGTSSYFDFGGTSFGDYMARRSDRPELAGLGRYMLQCWLARVRARDQLAIIEVQPLTPDDECRAVEQSHNARANRATAPLTRRRRLRLFQAYGFVFPDDVRYTLPSGASMRIGFRPRASQLRTGAQDHDTLAEVRAAIDLARQTYGP